MFMMRFMISNFLRRAGLKKKEGMGVIEIILIIVVLIGLVLIFKNQLTSLVKTLINNMKKDALAI